MTPPRGSPGTDADRLTPPRHAAQRTLLKHLLLVAERGRQIVHLSHGAGRSTELRQLCHRLLVQRGEATGLAIACDIVGQLDRMDAAGAADFLEMLAADFAVDDAAAEEAVDRWRAARHDIDAYLGLQAAVESPRQELFRRLNIAPGATAVIVHLRGRLLELLPERPHLRAVEFDLRHLLSSWFNRGFLRLETIDWRTPAAILEKLISYEAVHRIQSWEDLRQRLARDRRCFAFFHPALPDEPLIFVEVALTRDLVSSIFPLLDPDRTVGDPRRADTATFFSINNCQEGLRGISFGNFLIKQVAVELAAELPWIHSFATLSPLPRFAETLRRRDLDGGFTADRVRALIGDAWDELRQRTGSNDQLDAVVRAFSPGERTNDAVSRVAERVVLAYLTEVKRGDRVLDPVAHFHLSNGARLEHIRLSADPSAKGVAESHGVMVNYLYREAKLELNHERYVATGEVALSRSLANAQVGVAAAWRGAQRHGRRPAPSGSG